MFAKPELLGAGGARRAELAARKTGSGPLCVGRPELKQRDEKVELTRLPRGAAHLKAT